MTNSQADAQPAPISDSTNSTESVTDAVAAAAAAATAASPRVSAPIMDPNQPLHTLAASSATHQARSRSRQQPNWTLQEERDLLDLAQRYNRSWTQVLAASLSLRNNRRTAKACKEHYQRMQSSYKRTTATSAKRARNEQQPTEGVDEIAHLALPAGERQQHFHEFIQNNPSAIKAAAASASAPSPPPGAQPMEIDPEPNNSLPAPASSSPPANSIAATERQQRQELLAAHFREHDALMRSEINALRRGSPAPTLPPAPAAATASANSQPVQAAESEASSSRPTKRAKLAETYERLLQTQQETMQKWLQKQDEIASDVRQATNAIMGFVQQLSANNPALFQLLHQ